MSTAGDKTDVQRERVSELQSNIRAIYRLIPAQSRINYTMTSEREKRSDEVVTEMTLKKRN